MEDFVHFDAVLQRFKEKAGNFYMDVPLEVAHQFMPDRKPVRMVCVLNEKVEFQCVIRPKGDGGFFINIATQLRAEEKLRLGDKISAKVRRDESI